MVNDFVFLNRSLLDSRVFCDESLLRLWIWCMLKSNWKRGWFNDCEIKPGQFATGRSSAASELNISGSKWYRGMTRLSEFGMVKMEVVNRRFTLVSITNWHKYQKVRTAGEQPVDNRWTSNEQPADTIEEGNKGKKDKLLYSVPKRLQTEEIKEAILMWNETRSENGALIGLNPIVLQAQLMRLSSLSVNEVHQSILDAVAGGWKNLRRESKEKTKVSYGNFKNTRGISSTGREEAAAEF